MFKWISFVCKSIASQCIIFGVKTLYPVWLDSVVPRPIELHCGSKRNNSLYRPYSNCVSRKLINSGHRPLMLSVSNVTLRWFCSSISCEFSYLKAAAEFWKHSEGRKGSISSLLPLVGRGRGFGQLEDNIFYMRGRPRPEEWNSTDLGKSNPGYLQ